MVEKEKKQKQQNQMDYSKLKLQIKGNKQYLTITPEIHKKFNIDEFVQFLVDRNISNFDIDKIAGVVERATGKPEEIGPILRKYNVAKDNYIIINIESKMKATLTLLPFDELDDEITEYDIMFKLFKKGIKRKYIKREVIQEVIAKKKYMKPIVVAEGIPPINGRDAQLVYKIDLSKIGKPKEREDGKIDYRELDTVITVKKDQVLVEKIPPTEGTPGEDIYGNPVPAVPGKDVPLPAGKNTYITEDGLKLCAKIDGFVYISELGINVGDVFLVNSSLNYEIGNIHYKGDVYIKQNVLPGFTVESEEGNISIEGDVDGADIIALKGNIEIKGGAFGKAKIKALEGKVTVSMIQGQVEIEAKDVEILKYSYDSVIKVKNKAIVKTIVGGEIESKRDIIVEEAGSESYTETYLKIYDEEVVELKQKIEKKEKQKEELDKLLDNIAKSLLNLKKRLQIRKTISNEIKANVENRIKEYNLVKEKIEKLTKELKELKDKRDKLLKETGTITIKSKMYPNVIIVFYDRKLHNKDVITQTTVFLNSPEGIITQQ